MSLPDGGGLSRHRSDQPPAPAPEPGTPFAWPDADAWPTSPGSSHPANSDTARLDPAPPAPPAPPASPLRGRIIALIALIALVVAAGSTVATYALVDRTSAAAGGNAAGLTTTTQQAPAARVNGGVAAAAAAVGSSVVTINVSAGGQGGTGSGIIIRRDGYVLTNNHVVTLDSQTNASANRITVTLKDGSTKPATVVGTDTTDDLAVIKISATNLPAASFAPSSALTVGQTVVALGAPLGLSNTVTSGIVSALARPVATGGGGSSSIFDAIQTDAAINPGNSGGPLVDLGGHVVGVNSAIAGASSSGGGGQSGNIGIGFAIPSDEASRIATELIATGKATHAILGISVGGTQNNSGPTNATGATVTAVQAGSPAQQAGIRPGDVITRIGQQRIDDSVGAVAATRSHAPGAAVDVSLLVNGQAKTVSVTLGSAPNQ